MTGKQHPKTDTKSRGEIGQVSWKSLKDGSLRLNIPKQYSIGKEKQIQKRLGLKKTPENQAIADLITARLNELIATGNYNPEDIDNYLQEYKRLYVRPELQLPPKRSKTVKATTSLDGLWTMFCAYKQNLVKQTTFNGIFSTVTLHISKLETKDLGKADDIVAELRQQIKSASALYRTLSYLSNCCDWAASRDKTPKNPFKLILKDLKPPQTDCDPDPFTREGMNRVINAYSEEPKYYYYVPFIKFRFKTGCRFGEGVALKWKNVHLQEGYIDFCETITYTPKGYVHQKGTKTKLSRKFPINSSLQQLLEKQKSDNVGLEDYVFREPSGGFVKYPNFYTHWYGRKSGKTEKTFHKGIVTQLAELPEEEGGIDHYRTPYSTRHTFITLALDKLARKREVKLSDVAQLAEYVGNSVETIFKHYLGKSGDISIVDIEEDKADSALTVSQNGTQPPTETSTQLTLAYQLIEQLTQQINQLTQQNQLLQQQLAQLLSLQASLQQASSPPQPTEQGESIMPSDSDLAQLALLLGVNDQIEGKSTPPV